MGNNASMTDRFDDMVALVTGGASGIGQEICMEFAAEGAKIAIADIDASGSAAVVKAIKALGGEAIALEVDVTDYSRVAMSVARTQRELGAVDILVNCAGWNRPVLPNEYSKELWEKIRSINLDGPWNFSLAVMPEMMRRQKGKIINIASGAGLQGIPNCAPYSTAKHGVVGLTRSLAVDLAPFKINVNCICPGTVITPLVREVSSANFIEQQTRATPLGRLGKPSDIAKATLFLASTHAEWITGVALPVDGGLTCCIRAHHYE